MQYTLVPTRRTTVTESVLQRRVVIITLWRKQIRTLVRALTELSPRLTRKSERLTQLKSRRLSTGKSYRNENLKKKKKCIYNIGISGRYMYVYILRSLRLSRSLAAEEDLPRIPSTESQRFRNAYRL